MTRSARTRIAPLIVLILIALALPAVAQEGALTGSGLAGQSLRPYRFVFLAYAIAWLLVLGWVVSVARRAGSLSRRLGD